MKYPLTVLLLTILWVVSKAQPTDGLIAYYDFEDCTGSIVIDKHGNNNGILRGAPGISCNCGVEGEALFLDGFDDNVVFESAFRDLFNTKDFSLSFYFKPDPSLDQQILLSKRENCSNENYMEISYFSGSRTLSVLLQENSSKFNLVRFKLSSNSCWFHFGLVREGAFARVYINGRLVAENQAKSRVDIDNPADLHLSGSSGNICAADDAAYNGLIDEFRIYKRALRHEEVAQLWLRPDRIATKDTIIFIGEAVEVSINKTCSTLFDWTPKAGVSDPAAMEPLLSPDQTTTYTVNLFQDNCFTRDSIRITVIDPDALDCDAIFLPKAFTPNNDNLNDDYGISNPYAVPGLIAFEIFDRWGGRVFYTEDPDQRWDGTFQGTPLNPGVFLYRLRYNCNGEEKVKIDNLTLLR